MAEHKCNQIGKIATLEAEQKALKELSAKDIANMQKQLDNLNSILTKFVERFDVFMTTTASKEDVQSIKEDLAQYAGINNRVLNLEKQIKQKETEFQELLESHKSLKIFIKIILWIA